MVAEEILQHFHIPVSDTGLAAVCGSRGSDDPGVVRTVCAYGSKGGIRRGEVIKKKKRGLFMLVFLCLLLVFSDLGSTDFSYYQREQA